MPETPDFVLPTVSEPSDPDEALFPITLFPIGSDSSSCNPDVEGDTACF